ncbi:MAG: helix-turn-helix domain-containing protein [Lachnospiraceae bacterium]|nr:helix-turn-helix domain-containing protein [Lachnospiraceae bacterium]
MTVSEKIFELLNERGMSQKEFSEKTGIAQSSISDWKRKKTNPVSEKILIISEVLGVTPYELLSGIENVDARSKLNDYYVVSKDSELGMLIEQYQELGASDKGRLLGYLQAISTGK